ncbi:MAG: hypothetical protein LBH59_01655 [Planctomycetaceae bacterium]|nr:hypothetical protein [Planctomycetaceae bacterium]
MGRKNVLREWNKINSIVEIGLFQQLIMREKLVVRGWWILRGGLFVYVLLSIWTNTKI